MCKELSAGDDGPSEGGTAVVFKSSGSDAPEPGVGITVSSGRFEARVCRLKLTNTSMLTCSIMKKFHNIL